MRHIAGVFGAFAKDGKYIRVDAPGKEARVHQLVQLLSTRAHPVGDMEKGSNAHKALITQETRRLVDEGVVSVRRGIATMEPAFLKKQLGRSQSIRKQAGGRSGGQPPRYNNTVPPRRTTTARVRAV